MKIKYYFLGSVLALISSSTSYSDQTISGPLIFKDSIIDSDGKIGAMGKDGVNATLPDATRNFGLEYTVKPGTSIQSKLTAATANGGGRVFIQTGTYAQTTPLFVGSNTHIVCEKGAIITATNSGWSHVNFPNLTANNDAIFVNVNHAASSLTDENIIIENCDTRALGTFATDGNFFHIYIRRAQHVVIRNNNFLAGGDAVALLANDDTLVTNNYGKDMAQCWDHWEAPKRVKVHGGVCTGAKIGALVTGTRTAADDAGVADDYEIIGGTYVLSSAIWGTGGLGIWVNGLGTAGSGAANGRIVKPYIDMTLMAAGPCVRATGSGTRNVNISVTCKGGTLHAVDVSNNGDGGGSPQDYTISVDAFGLNTTGPAVNMSGSNGLLHSSRLVGSIYSYIAAGSGDAAKVDVFSLNASGGTTGLYNLTGSGSGTNTTGVFDIEAAGIIKSSGTNASLSFQAKDLAQVWSWYADANITRLYNGTSDTITVYTDGALITPGKLIGSRLGVNTASSWTNNQTCTLGEIMVDASFIYVCTATNTVKRSALSAF